MRQKEDEMMAMAASIPDYPSKAARKAAKRQRRGAEAVARATGASPALSVVPAPTSVSASASAPTSAAQRTLVAQRERQDHYRRLWQRQIAALVMPDDDAYAVMRTARIASDHGTARSTVVSAIPPALLHYLERGHASTPPAPPCNPRVRAALGEGGRDRNPARLARARVALAHALPDHSLVLELTGWQLISEHDLARAFDERTRAGWSRPSIHNRKWEAVTWLRQWLAQG